VSIKPTKLVFTKKNFNTFWSRMILSVIISMTIITIIFLIQHS